MLTSARGIQLCNGILYVVRHRVYRRPVLRLQAVRNLKVVVSHHSKVQGEKKFSSRMEKKKEQSCDPDHCITNVKAILAEGNSTDRRIGRQNDRQIDQSADRQTDRQETQKQLLNQITDEFNFNGIPSIVVGLVLLPTVLFLLYEDTGRLR